MTRKDILIFINATHVNIRLDHRDFFPQTDRQTTLQTTVYTCTVDNVQTTVYTHREFFFPQTDIFFPQTDRQTTLQKLRN